MAADSKPGSRTWHRAMDTTFEVEPTIFPDGNKWVCQHDTEWCTPGVGDTPEEAYVDYVEESWCVSGQFPKGYPN